MHNKLREVHNIHLKCIEYEERSIVALYNSAIGSDRTQNITLNFGTCFGIGPCYLHVIIYVKIYIVLILSI